MIVELIGGPRDGEVVDIPDDAAGYIGDSPIIDDDFELYFPHDEQIIEPISIYRWLFGRGDHLDFAGWKPRMLPPDDDDPLGGIMSTMPPD